ncbi:hypothetical protein K470DRAFT_257002 [Piedraia hortae CBS 480.64]|uniref:Uncharacterized protein n=1 Tax=Piedraia hortae CBS 480.64 TaxID=1314780 RepID=A0A6A7C2Z7_9PEZI|nr:hypothetical protein K470DRAFT_257002 [Piedraia hortae CBS 480.64]
MKPSILLAAVCFLSTSYAAPIRLPSRSEENRLLKRQSIFPMMYAYNADEKLRFLLAPIVGRMGREGHTPEEGGQ